MKLFDRFRRTGKVVEQNVEADSKTADQEATQLIDEGNTIERRGQIDQAMKYYLNALSLSPNLARAHLNHGNILAKKGEAAGALHAYDTAIRLDPGYVAAYFNKGNLLHDLKQYAAAITTYRKVLDINPDLVIAHNNLGLALQDSGLFQDALESYRTAVSTSPDFAQGYFNLGNLLQQLGRLDEAWDCFQKATEIQPDNATAHFCLGNTLQAIENYDLAMESYCRALALRPDFIEAQSNLGNAFHSLGKTDLAIASFQKAIDINNDSAIAHNNLGLMLKLTGRLEEAATSFARVTALDVNHSEAWINLGITLQLLGQPNKSLDCFLAALKTGTHLAEAHFRLGNALQILGRFQEAAKSFRLAIKIQPEFAVAHCNLGHVLRELGQSDDAMACFSHALQIDPDSALAHANMGVIQQDRGDHAKAVVSFRKALMIEPDSDLTYSNYLFALTHLNTISAKTLFEEHRHFGQHFEDQLRNAVMPDKSGWEKVHSNDRQEGRRLRIGFVSGDLRYHAVAHFLEPVLEHLCNSAELELHAYYNHPVEDKTSERLLRHLTNWHQITNLSDDMLAAKIRNDGMDILVDLSGHTGRNRLLTFARKPAPIQASWIGYPHTTGLLAMDYYLADRHFLPQGRFDGQFTEKLVRLPASTPFQPILSAPLVNSLPATECGYLTFGSFNRISKLSPDVISLWSQLLRALPKARMLLGAIPEGNEASRLIQCFATEGIESERLILHPRVDMNRYLKLHHQVDICLDTFPYSGGTTTNHALWMGVPTLSLDGETPPGRQGAANLGYVGLESFVACDKAEFVQKGLHWENHLTDLADLRASLRNRFAQVPTRKPEMVAAALERALRIMWQRWCAGLPAESFDVEEQQGRI